MDKETILIVDDISENIDVLAGLLQDIYSIKVAVSGEEALRLVFSTKINLVLTDIMMPGMDGYEVCSKIKNNRKTKNIPVIFVSAKNEVLDEYKGFEVGGVDYIRKPIVPPIVLSRVKTHLALYDQNRLLEKKVRKRTKEVVSTRLEIIRHLGRAAEYKDNETGLHVIRMSKYCELVALAYGLSEDEATVILHAAPMHDIGKIGIPDNVLLKPGKLNDDEWSVMKRHPIIGTDIISEHSSRLLTEARIAARTHHEKWDGSGYPEGTSGEEIPLIGRIVAIADVFDALTSERPYKNAWTVDEALFYIKKERGAHFDPKLVDAFVQVLPGILKIKDEYGE